MPPRADLVLVSVSGAQATGKSTLLAALEADLVGQKGAASVVRTTSASSRLFERWQKRELPNAPMPVKTFDEIDKRGHREWFQRSTPDSLCLEVEIALQKLGQTPSEVCYLLVDRWFPDIMAYTRQCLRSDAIAQRQIRTLCRDRHESLTGSVLRHFPSASFVSVFVPLASCHFKVADDPTKFRATTDREEFERLCLEEWPLVVNHLPTIKITSTGLQTRVFDVKMAISAARLANAKRSATSSRAPRK